MDLFQHSFEPFRNYQTLSILIYNTTDEPKPTRSFPDEEKIS